MIGQDYKNVSEEKEDEAQYFCKFTFGQFFTILVLEVVTLAFVFYLGAKYGTDYLKISQDEEGPLVTEIVAGGSALQTPSATQDAELQTMAQDVVRGGSGSDLKDRVKELLAKQEAPATTPSAGMGIGEQAVTVPAPALTQPIQTAETSQKETGLPKTTIDTEAKPAPDLPVQKSPDSGVIRMKSAVGNQYSIQVGSYPNMNEASSRVEEWRNKGYPAFMMIADIPDRGRWYRVRIGGFAAKEDAQKYLEKIKANEGTEGIVVLNEQ